MKKFVSSSGSRANADVGTLDVDDIEVVVRVVVIETDAEVVWLNELVDEESGAELEELDSEAVARVDVGSTLLDDWEVDDEVDLDVLDWLDEDTVDGLWVLLGCELDDVVLNVWDGDVRVVDVRVDDDIIGALLELRVEDITTGVLL